MGSNAELKPTHSIPPQALRSSAALPHGECALYPTVSRIRKLQEVQQGSCDVLQASPWEHILPIG